MKKLVIGILAHVDAGKTTLSEALLYESGAIRRLGRCLKSQQRRRAQQATEEKSFHPAQALFLSIHPFHHPFQKFCRRALPAAHLLCAKSGEITYGQISKIR